MTVAALKANNRGQKSEHLGVDVVLAQHYLLPVWVEPSGHARPTRLTHQVPGDTHFTARGAKQWRGWRYTMCARNSPSDPLHRVQHVAHVAACTRRTSHGDAPHALAIFSLTLARGVLQSLLAE